jgi:hypothetical protein
MKSFHEWLDRTPSGPKKRRQLKRHNRISREDVVRIKRTRIRAVSKKHAKGLREYFKVRAEYMAEHRACEAGPVILGAKLPPEYRLPKCTGFSVEVHHVAGRGPNLSNTDTFCATCKDCHVFIHAHGQWARSVGLLT